MIKVKRFYYKLMKLEGLVIAMINLAIPIIENGNGMSFAFILSCSIEIYELYTEIKFLIIISQEKTIPPLPG